MKNKIHGYIYMITNLINNKVYIGQTTYPINSRFSRHIYLSKSKKPITLISKTIKKYSIENFKIEQIDIAYNQEQLNLLEGVYISWFKSLVPNGYNITNIINGVGSMNIETREKISKKHRGMSSKNSRSKYCGVNFSGDRWIARYQISGVRIYLGCFKTEEEAGKAYDIEAIKHDSDAFLNFPELKQQYLNNEVVVNKCKWSYPKNIKKSKGRTRTYDGITPTD